MTLYLRLFIIKLLFVLLSPCLFAAPPTDITIFDLTESKIIASDGASSDNFGKSVGISGNRIIVASTGDDDGGSNSGSVYIYEYDGSNWNETKLTASDAEASDDFGSSVAISGTTAIVGASKEDANGADSGAVYIYEYDGSNWNETKLTASDGLDGDRFGISVAISGNRAVVGAHNNDTNGGNSGAAYIYEKNGSVWNETKITNSDGATNDFFGFSVGISVNTVIVGAYGNSDSGTFSGSAYIYDYNGSNWIETKLTASDAAATDFFGRSVAISGSRAVVGAYSNDDAGSSSGSIYVYEYTTSWIETKLTASDAQSGDNFGYMVSISGNKIIASAYGDDDNESSSGSAYILQSNGGSWDETKVTADDGASSDLFGWSAAISGDIAIVGSYSDDDNGSASGSAYIYNFVSNSSISESAPDGTLISKLTAIDPDSSAFTYTEITDTDNIFDIVGNEVRLSTGANLNYNLNTSHSVTIEVEDESGGTYQETMVFNVIDTDDAKAVNDSYNSSEDSVLIIDTANGVLSNDVDYSNTSLASSIVSLPSFGSLQMFDDGSFTYTPYLNFNGVDQFTYRCTNGLINYNDAVVTINISSSNDDPHNIFLPLPQVKLTATDGLAGDTFGHSVDISGDEAIVGAPLQNNLDEDDGTAYIYTDTGNGWSEWKLTPSDADTGDLYGTSVGISSGKAIVGALQNDDDGNASGSAYIYEFNGSTWDETKITASDASEGDFFGISTAIHIDTAIVGAYGNDSNGEDAGAAYVYTYDGLSWQESKLTASDGAADDFFGYSVNISADTAIVGAYQDDDNGNASGSAYIYRYDGSNWNETKLTASDGAAGDLYGWSVAISGDTAVVGSIQDDDNGSSSGSVYVYQYDGSNWNETKLTPNDASSGDFFGRSVDISGNRIIVGANSNDDKGLQAGAAYIYEFDGSNWNETKLMAIDAQSGDELGWSSAISDNYVVTGAYQDDDNGNNSGSAYIHTIKNNTEIVENRTGGTLISILDAADVDSSTFTYTKVLDPDNVFEIVGNELRLAASANIDYETQTTHSVAIEVSDGSGGTLQMAFNFTVINIEADNIPDYANWWSSNFFEGEANSGLTADADGDGISNIMEYTFHTDPHNFSDKSNFPAASSPLPGNLSITYTRNDEMGDDPFLYEVSNDLSLWSVALEGVNFSKSIVNNGDGSETVTLDFGLPSTKLFVRTNIIAD